MKFNHLIIGLTGNAMDDDVLKFLDAGADDVLVKPLKSEHLDEILLQAEKNNYLSQIKLAVTNLYPLSRMSSIALADDNVL